MSILRLLCVLAFALPLTAQVNSAPANSAGNSAQAFRISGVVVNANTREPVNQAEVQIANVEKLQTVQNFTTNTDGRFHFENLARGKYVLVANAPGFSRQNFNEHFQYSTAIAIGPDLQSENLVFQLRPDAFVVGVVTDEAGEAIRNAQVMLFRQGTETGEQEIIQVAQNSTNDLGRFLFGHLVPGTYFVAVAAQPWYVQVPQPRYKIILDSDGKRRYEPMDSQQRERSPLDVAYPLTYYSGVTDSSEATPIALKPGDRAEADVSLSPVPAVHLRIPVGDNQGRVGANLSQNVFGRYPLPVPGYTYNPGTGELEVNGVAPGNYSVTVNTFGKEQHSSTQEIDLTENAKMDSWQGTPPTTINGVVSLDGQSATHGYVQIYSRVTRGNYGTQLSSKGEFKITADDLKPGTYDVFVFGVPRAVVTGLLASGADVAGKTITLKKGTPVQMAIAMSSALGQIDGVAQLKDKPKGGAMVVLVPDDPEVNASLFRRDQSDSDGTFTLRDVVPGKYTVLAIANGWDLEWDKASVLKPYMTLGQKLEVGPKGKYQVKVPIQ